MGATGLNAKGRDTGMSRPLGHRRCPGPVKGSLSSAQDKGTAEYEGSAARLPGGTCCEAPEYLR